MTEIDIPALIERLLNIGLFDSVELRKEAVAALTRLGEYRQECLDLREDIDRTHEIGVSWQRRAEKAEAALAEAEYVQGNLRRNWQAAVDALAERDKRIAELEEGLKFYAADRREYEDGGSVEEDKGAYARLLTAKQKSPPQVSI